MTRRLTPERAERRHYLSQIYNQPKEVQEATRAEWMRIADEDAAHREAFGRHVERVALWAAIGAITAAGCIAATLLL